MANITTQEFASELGTDTRTARKFLRSITPKEEQPGKGARWEIDGTKRSLNTMKKNFNEWRSAQETARKEREAAVEETEEPTVEEVEDNLDD